MNELFNGVSMKYITFIGLCVVALAVVNANAQGNKVDRLQYDSDTGNFVDRWTVESAQVQQLPAGFTALGLIDRDVTVCNALFDDTYYIWTQGEVVISPNGQQIGIDPAKMISYNGNQFEIMDAEQIDSCGALAALLFPAAGGAIVTGPAVAAGVVGTAATAAVIDGGGDGVTTTPPPASPAQ